MEHIGKYVVKEELGRGATSVVYRAFDPFRGTEVAVKVIDRAVFDRDDDPLARTGFLVEASLVGKLDHPHVARIFDVVDGPDDHYVVMEYVPGGTLERYTRAGALMDTDSAIDVVFKVAKALEHVHSLGLVHRDIKPANILLHTETDIRLSDFGAALTKALTSTQDIKAGSPFYMSPEQIGGGTLDFRSDMFSLGVVFYELLTGQKPFQANSLASLAYQLATVEPPPPSSLRERIPKHVDEVVMRALRKSPEDRFASWTDFVQALANEEHFDADRPAAGIAIDTQTDRYSLVRRCPFFEAFDDANLWEVIVSADLRRAVEGDVIMREGEVGDAFFVILAGQVRVTKRGRLIDVMRAGVSFGELSYILRGKRPRNASCVALTDAIILRASDEWLGGASQACRSLFEAQFLRQMSMRLVEANERIAQG